MPRDHQSSVTSPVSSSSSSSSRGSNVGSIGRTDVSTITAAAVQRQLPMVVQQLYHEDDVDVVGAVDVEREGNDGTGKGKGRHHKRQRSRASTKADARRKGSVTPSSTTVAITPAATTTTTAAAPAPAVPLLLQQLPYTQQLHGVVLFADVSGFTGLCENADADSRRGNGIDNVAVRLNVTLSTVSQAILVSQPPKKLM